MIAALLPMTAAFKVPLPGWRLSTAAAATASLAPLPALAEFGKPLAEGAEYGDVILYNGVLDGA